MRRRGMVMAPRRMGRPGLLGTMARTAVVAGTATAVAGGVSRHASQRAEEQDQDAAAQQQQVSSAASASARASAGRHLGQDQGTGRDEIPGSAYRRRIRCPEGANPGHLGVCVQPRGTGAWPVMGRCRTAVRRWLAGLSRVVFGLSAQSLRPAHEVGPAALATHAAVTCRKLSAEPSPLATPARRRATLRLRRVGAPDPTWPTA